MSSYPFIYTSKDVIHKMILLNALTNSWMWNSSLLLNRFTLFFGLRLILMRRWWFNFCGPDSLALGPDTPNRGLCGGTTQKYWARVHWSSLLGNSDPNRHAPIKATLFQDRTDNTHTKVSLGITTQIISYISEFAVEKYIYYKPSLE